MVVGSLETVKTMSDVAANAVTIIGVLVGGYWTYRTFIRERTKWPKATVELAMSHRKLNAEKTLLHVKVKIHNAGRGLMRLNRIRVDVAQVKPMPDETEKKLVAGCLKPKDDSVADWKVLEEGEFHWGAPGQGAQPELEPGENDEFGSDFFIASAVETVYIYVYIENEARKKNKLGWCVTSYYDLEGGAGANSAMNVISSKPAKEAA